MSCSLVERSSGTDVMWKKLEGTHVASEGVSEEGCETTVYVLI